MKSQAALPAVVAVEEGLAAAPTSVAAGAHAVVAAGAALAVVAAGEALAVVAVPMAEAQVEGDRVAAGVPAPAATTDRGCPGTSNPS